MAGQFDLTGKVAVVTGGSRGLGQYFSRALARAGADVAITSRTLEALEQTRTEIEAVGRTALPCVLDTRKMETIQPMVDQVLGRFGRIDILVNNAGCNIRKPAVDMTPEDWDTVVGTILRGAFFVSTAVARSAMIPQKQGRIVNIGSGTSLFGMPGIVALLRGAGRHDADDEGPGGGMGPARDHRERAGAGLVQDAADRHPLRGSGVGDQHRREDPRGTHGAAQRHGRRRGVPRLGCRRHTSRGSFSSWMAASVSGR